MCLGRVGAPERRIPLRQIKLNCEEQSPRVCLKLEDDLRKREECRSNLSKMIAFKNGVTAFQWDVFQE